MIQLKHISKVYKRGNIETVALDDFSLTINAGDFVVVEGFQGRGNQRCSILSVVWISPHQEIIFLIMRL